MIYICQRCGYSSNHKSNFIKHLKTKKICPPNNEDTPRLNILNKLEEFKNLDKQYQCEYCESKFGHSSSYYRHKKTCKKTKIIIDQEELDKIIDKKIEEKMKNMVTTQNIGTQNNQTAEVINNDNSNNKIVNNYYNVNKPSYSENLFTLDEQIKLIKEAADDPITFGMSAYHKEKYFNENRKDLQCIKLTPDLLQENKIGIYNGKYWEEKNLHELLPQITDEAGKFVGILLYDGKTAFQIEREKNMEMRNRVDNLVLNQTSEDESSQILDKMTDDFVKYTEEIHK
jgi:flagellar motility protein MotE (MotC chaperone)